MATAKKKKEAATEVELGANSKRTNRQIVETQAYQRRMWNQLAIGQLWSGYWKSSSGFDPEFITCLIIGFELDAEREDGMDQWDSTFAIRILVDNNDDGEGNDRGMTESYFDRDTDFTFCHLVEQVPLGYIQTALRPPRTRRA